MVAQTGVMKVTLTSGEHSGIAARWKMRSKLRVVPRVNFKSAVPLRAPGFVEVPRAGPRRYPGTAQHGLREPTRVDSARQARELRERNERLVEENGEARRELERVREIFGENLLRQREFQDDAVASLEQLQGQLHDFQTERGQEPEEEEAPVTEPESELSREIGACSPLAVSSRAVAEFNVHWFTWMVDPLEQRIAQRLQ